MSDQMKRKGISIDIPLLEAKLKTRIALVSTRENKGLDLLKELLINYRKLSIRPTFKIDDIDQNYFDDLKKAFPNQQFF
jgi:ferrous iron transport protein B